MFIKIKETIEGKPFGFYTNHSIGDAKHILYDLYVQSDAPLTMGLNTFYVDILGKNDFRCWKIFRRGRRVECYGRLENHTHGVYVTGEIYANSIMKLSLFWSILIFILFASTGYIGSALMGFAIVCLSMFDIVRKQHMLYETLFDALGKPKKKSKA